MLVYAVTIFLSAFLLFQIQPLIAKVILPWFGGAPNVWTTCMLFFQVVLLGGYLYADILNRFVRPTAQWVVHGVLLTVSLIFLKVIPGGEWKPDAQESSVSGILLILAVSIGLPYFILSTTGPLIQAAFARRYPGRSPYRLFALSNLGSLLALITFPFLFEPFFAISEHSFGWSIAYWVFAGACLVALIVSRRAVGDPVAIDRAALAVDDGLSAKTAGSKPRRTSPFVEILLWLALSLVPSVLLLATTSHLSHSVAVMPFLWIAPLALYLISFIICFDKPSWYRRDLWGVVMLIAMSLTVMGTTVENSGIVQTALVYLLAQFAASMVCHGELAALRPEPARLTFYYLMISLGGALGGMFVVLAAPALFREFHELQLSLWAATALFALRLVASNERRSMFRVAFFGSWIFLIICIALVFFQPDFFRKADSALQRYTLIGALWFVALTSLIHRQNEFAWAAGRERSTGSARALNVVVGMTFLFLVALSAGLLLDPVRTLEFGQPLLLVFLMFLVLSALLANGQFAALKNSGGRIAALFAIAAVLLGAGYWGKQMLSVSPKVLYQSRDFFGLMSIEEEEIGVNEIRRAMRNGQVFHGVQYLQFDSSGARQVINKPSSYYGPLSGAGIALTQHPRRETDSLRIGVIGLGTGSVAIYARPGDELIFYEIKPDCERAARKYFSYLEGNAAGKDKTSVFLGDARIVLEKELQEGKNQQFDVLIVDAFSGDAVPRHLMTRESFELYRKHLKPDGIIAFNISNSHFDFTKVVVALADEVDWKTAWFKYRPGIEGDDLYLVLSSWIIATANEAFMQQPVVTLNKESLENVDPVLWTDDFGGLWQIMDLNRP